MCVMEPGFTGAEPAQQLSSFPPSLYLPTYPHLPNLLSGNIKTGKIKVASDRERVRERERGREGEGEREIEREKQ